MNITEKAMLVRVVLHTWTGRKIDREATRETQRANNAEAGTGVYVKQLIDKDFLDQTHSKFREVRTFHYENTLPWGDDNFRILSSANYFAYTEGIRKKTAEADESAKYLVEQYQEKVDEYSARLGDMFNRADYPGANSIQSKFGVDVNIIPMPDKDDFRVALSEDEVKGIKENIQSTVDNALDEAQKEAWTRLHRVVANMSEQLKKDKPRIHDSLVGNIEKMCELLPQLKIVDDPELDEVIAEAKKNLASRIPENLRKDKKERTETAKQADVLLKKLADYA